MPPVKIYIIALTCIFSIALPVTSNAEPNYRQRNNFNPHLTDARTSIDFGAGMRFDTLDWNIASDLSGTSTPNILSELTWDELAVFELSAKARHVQPASIWPLKGGIMIEGEITGGVAISGENQDSDYNGNDRTLEFSRSNNDGSGGYSYGFSTSAGYQFNVAESVRRGSYLFITFTPFAGYAWDEQQYKMTDGNQTIPSTGSFAGLDSEYVTQWSGPFYGAEIGIEKNRHALTLRGEYHDLDYDAEAIWNLRTDFKQDPSFIHEGDGDGIQISANYSYALDSKYEFTSDWTYTSRSIEDGLDILYFSNGNVSTQKLNEVNNESHAVRFGLNYMW